MRITALIARYLLGIIFLVFGTNGFLHFIHMPDKFMGAVFASHLYIVIFFMQVAGAVLLLIGRYVPLGLVLLGPVIFNIFFFHVFMSPAGLPLAIVVVILWLLVFYSVRSNFEGIFAAKA